MEWFTTWTSLRQEGLQIKPTILHLVTALQISKEGGTKIMSA